jgi:uncharacterized protein YcfL
MPARLPVRLALLLASLSSFAGCQVPSSIIVRSEGGAAGPSSYVVEQQNPELANLVRVVRAVPRTDTGERVAQIDVQSVAKTPVALEYQFRWRDRFGSEFVQLWEWRHITVAAGQTVRLEDEVADSEWVHYTCELRLAK